MELSTGLNSWRQSRWLGWWHNRTW